MVVKDIMASVVAYRNDPATLLKSIQSFLDSAGDTVLYFVDNSPDDQLKNIISDPRVIYIHVGKNIGFGPGHNIAMRKTIDTARYHLVLDPDVYFDTGVIPELVRYMDSEPAAGLVMPKVLFPNGQLQRYCKLLPTPWTLIVRRFFKSITPLTRVVNRNYELQFADYNGFIDAPFLSGCFMFFRCASLQRIGLFDERFFLYMEDVDISRRMHEQFRTVYYPHASIYHFYGQAPYKNIRALLVNIQSAVTYFNKWGWFFDRKRKSTNAKILHSLGVPH